MTVEVDGWVWHATRIEAWRVDSCEAKPDTRTSAPSQGGVPSEGQFGKSAGGGFIDFCQPARRAASPASEDRHALWTPRRLAGQLKMQRFSVISTWLCAIMLRLLTKPGMKRRRANGNSVAR